MSSGDEHPMKPRTRILRQRHQGERGGFDLYITHHDEGAGDVYECETGAGDVIARGSLDRVEKAATEHLKSEGHECGDSCSAWERCDEEQAQDSPVDDAS